MLAHGKLAMRAAFAERSPVRNATPPSLYNLNSGTPHREPTEIRRHRPRPLRYPFDQRRARQIESALKRNVDLRFADPQRNSALRPQ